MAFFGRHFVVLWHGQLVSQLGNQAFLIAATLFTLEATGSATTVAALMMASTLPLAVLSPIAGTFADRHSRRAILVVTDFVRAGAVGGLALALLWQPDAAASLVTLVIAVAFVGGVMSAFFSPAVHALVPDLVPGERLAAANSVTQTSNQAAILIGQAIGGVLYARWGAVGLMLFDALSFAYAGAATWLLPRDRTRRQPRLHVRLAIRHYVAETVDGMAWVRRSSMTGLLLMFTGVNFLFMPVFVLLPIYTLEVLGGGPEWYGFLLAGSGSGALAGSLAAGFLLARLPRRTDLIRVCVLGVACAVLLLALARQLPLALAVFVGIGMLTAFINVTVITTFQAAVPPALRGRVMALVIALSTAAVPVGMGLGGVIGEIWRESLRIVFAGCGVAIVALVSLTWRTGRLDAAMR